MEEKRTKLIGEVQYVWNPYAYDYSAGVEIYDPETMFIYTDEQAHQLPKEVKSRLCMRGKKIGCWVVDYPQPGDEDEIV